MNNNNEHIPPRLAERFLMLFLRDELAEEVLGDLDEKFYSHLESKSVIKAKFNYWYQVFNYLRPFAFKNYRSNSNNLGMLNNYIKIGYRNLYKNKEYSFINIFGLAIGMSVALLIGLWVYDELSFNKYHNNYDRIGQVLFHEKYEGGIETGDSAPTGLGTYIKNNYSAQFEKVVLVRARLEERLISNDNNHFSETGHFMQPGGPEMFGLKMVAGSHDGLNGLKSILLSQSLAQKIFKDESPLGQTVRFNEQVDLEVTGVYKDLPKNSRFNEAAYLAPLDVFLYGWSDLNVWDNQNMYLFVQLRDGKTFNESSQLIESVLEPHWEDRQCNVFVHPMSDWHLHSAFKDGHITTDSKTLYIWFFSAIGIAVLLLACVNFMNLSTARSQNRAKEIGIRKSMGSLRHQLMSQFLSESTLIAFLAFFICLGLVSTSLPMFNDLAAKDMTVPWTKPMFWLIGIGFTLLTGILAGIYPALYLSSFNPVKSLKGAVKIGKHAALPRKVLVVFQFTVSIALIIGTIIIYQQIEFVKERPVGYMRDGLLMLPKRSSELYGKFDVLRSELLKTGVVEEVGEANYPLTTTLGNNGGFSWEGMTAPTNISFNTISVNQEYGKAIGWELIAGRDFSRDHKTDNKSIVITELAAKKLGLQNPVGTVIKSRHDYWGSPEFTIIGVVRDLIKGDPFEESRPAIMFLSEREMRWQFVRIKENYPQNKAMVLIEQVYKKVAPDAFTDFKLINEEYNHKFKAEESISRLATFFAILAILISCMGLFGLAAYLIEKRKKEIGIRKVLGASISKIWVLLTKDFIQLVILAGLIAAPIAYYFLSQWVDQYTYHMDISGWVFLYTAFGALVIATLTVSFQAVKSAITNPVDAIRSE